MTTLAPQPEPKRDVRGFISSWTHGEDWQTWVAHSAIALLIAVVAGILGGLVTDGDGVIIGATAAIAYYLIRELEQTLYAWVDHKPIDWKDNVIDVVAPALVVGLLALVIEALK